jgi:uncharacterized repeat protein (TIGR03803 family)
LPEAALIQGTDGNLYGTTVLGGAYTGCEGDGCGTVFKISPNGGLKALFNFNGINGAYGQNPYGGLVQGTDGKLYGTAFFGGLNGGFGTVFKMSPNGMMLANPYSFGGYDGENPSASLAKGTNGKFYGTTVYGGNGSCANGGCGTVFTITPGLRLTTIYRFCSQSGCPDGNAPEAEVAQGTDGKFYGTTSEGGANSSGTVFRISPGGVLSTLYNFCSQGGSSCTDGATPYAGLVQGTDGKFYGTTSSDGANGNFGTVFSISVGGAPSAGK